jgi:hypothetical protein
MMDAQLIVPKGADCHWIMRRATGGKPYDLKTEEQEDGTILMTYDAFYDAAVKAERSGYAVNYLEVARPRAIARIAAIGKEKARRNFSFGGRKIELDDKTEARLTGLAVWLSHRPLVLEVRWDRTGAGDFIALPRDIGLAMGLAAGDHLQACFDRRATLTERVNTAASIEDAVFAEIETGWPGDPAP